MSGLFSSGPKDVEVLGKQNLGQHPGGISALAVSPKRVVSAAADETAIRLWDAATGAKLGSLHGHTQKVLDLAISAREDRVASSSEDKSVRVWELGSLQEVMKIELQEPGKALAFSPSGDSLAIGGEECTISITELPSGQKGRVLRIDPKSLKDVFKEPPKSVSAIAFSPRGTHLAALVEGFVTVWDLAADNTATMHAVMPHQFFKFRFSSDNRYLVAAGGKFSVRISFSPGGPASVQISDFGGVLFLLDLSTGITKSVTTGRIVFENAALSADASKVIAVASVPPPDNGVEKALHAYPTAEIINENSAILMNPKGALKLGRGALRASSDFGTEGTPLAQELGKDLWVWNLGF